MKRLACLAALLSLSIIAPIEPLAPNSAEAGVLLRSQRIRSQLRVRPRARLRYNIPKSTALYNRLNPINEGSYNSPDRLFKRIQKERKYEKKLYQWRLKQAKRYEQDRIKERRKKDLAKRKALKKAEKAKQLERNKRGIIGTADDSESSSKLADKGEKNATERATKGQKIEGEKQKKPSFWSRVWKALFPGNKKSS